MPQHAYTYLHCDKLRLEDLPAVIAHDIRTAPAMHVILTEPKGWTLLHCEGSDNDPMAAFYRRQKASGALLPNECRYVAMETLLAISPEHDHEPSKELYFARCVEFVRKKWGINVLAVFGHADERTLHVHALVALVCDGRRPGRVKGGVAGTALYPVFSWNLFSGSDKVRYEQGQEAPQQTDNPVLAQWQTDYALVWADHGYIRGFPSNRPSVRPSYIHGKTAAIAAAADISRQGIEKAIEGFRVPDSALAGKTPDQASKIIQEAQKAVLLPLLKLHLGQLTELASRGIQLPLEQASRADMGKRNEALKRENEGLRNGHAVVALEAEIAGLRSENEGLIQAVQKTYEQTGREYIEALTDAELEALFADEAKRRETLNAMKPKAVRPLPMPMLKNEGPNPAVGGTPTQDTSNWTM